MRILSIFLILAFILIGCQSSFTNGGETTFTKITEESRAGSNGNPETKKTTVTASVKQPQAPKDGAAITFKDKADGTIELGTETGQSQDLANIGSAIAKISMLHPVIYAGVALCVLGILVGVIAKQIYWGVGLFLGGMTMILGAFLIAQYAIYFGLIGVIVIIWFFYTMYTHRVISKGVEENTKVVELLKKEIPPEKKARLFDEKTGQVSLIQSPSTKKMVKKTRQNLGL